MAKKEELERRLILVEQLLNYHHAEIVALWAEIDSDKVVPDPKSALSDEISRFSVAAEIVGDGMDAEEIPDPTPTLKNIAAQAAEPELFPVEQAPVAEHVPAASFEPQQAPAAAEQATPAPQPAVPAPEHDDFGRRAYESAAPETQRHIDVYATVEGKSRGQVAAEWAANLMPKQEQTAPAANEAVPEAPAAPAAEPASATTPQIASTQAEVNPDVAPAPAESTPQVETAQPTQVMPPVIPQEPAPAPTPASRFAGQSLAAAFAAITTADAHDFAEEFLTRHSVTNGGNADLATALIESVVVNIVEEAPAAARTLDTLRSMTAQDDSALQATFEPLAQGLHYDVAAGAWVRSTRTSAHPALAPWNTYISAGELPRMLAREAAMEALKGE